LNNAEYPASLELHKVYRLLPDKNVEVDGDFRIVDESGEDYVYPAKLFAPMNLAPKSVTSSLQR
jgi:hypothetical protein